MSIGSVLFRLGFELSPIVLQGGIAAKIGQYLPIVSITEAANFTTGLLDGGDPDLDIDQFFAHWVPMPGGTIIENQLGRYPFANQAVAANAIIAQPLHVSMKMICPVQNPGGYASKLATMVALQILLNKHSQLGGTYIVATPSFIYTNCILTRIVDISAGETKQSQYQWQWDFEQPLLTLAQAQQVQNTLYSRMSAQTQIAGDPPTAAGLDTATTNPLGIAGPSVVSAAQNLTGATIAPATAVPALVPVAITQQFP